MPAVEELVDELEGPAVGNECHKNRLACMREHNMSTEIASEEQTECTSKLAS